MVLEDGETFTGLTGCSIVEIPNDHDEGVEGMGFPVVATFDNPTGHKHIMLNIYRPYEQELFVIWESTFRRGS